jgi:AraC-like DNA-binding protein
MQLQRILPAAPLRAYISAYEVIRGKDRATGVPPQLSSGVAFLWGDAQIVQAGNAVRLPPRYLIPVNQQPFDTASLSANTVVGVKFHPGKFYAFFGWPQDMFDDQTVELDLTPLGKEFSLLHEALDEAPSLKLQIALLNQFFLRRMPADITGSILPQQVLQRIYRTADLNLIHSKLRSLKASPRHLRRTFKTATGLSIQRFIRIYRFYQAYYRLLHGKFDSFADLAYSCGYFDQAHLDHDFKHFTGRSPSVFYAAHTPLIRALAWQGTDSQSSRK